MISQVLPLIAAFFVATLLTPLFRHIAIRLGVVDKPDLHRKLHREEIALCGGPVVLASLLVVFLASLMYSDVGLELLRRDPWPTFGLVIACVAIVGLGMLDDRFNLRGRQKLVGQLLIASFLAFCGYQFRSTSLFGVTIDLGILSFVFSIGWLLLAINSFNLIDGADGLCCSVGWIACAAFAAMAAAQSHYAQAAFAAAMAGALLGFLVFNFPPAKVFLGDSGSMLIGLVLGCLAIRSAFKSPTAISMIGAAVIMALPIFDSSMAIVRRKLTGRSIFSTDRGHIHHQMQTRGIAQSQLVLVVSILCGILAFGALLSVQLQSEAYSLGSVFLVISCLVLGRMFGHSELKLLVNRVKHIAVSLVPILRTDTKHVNQIHCRLQGDRSWEAIWDAMVEFADKHDLARVCLDLNVPWMYEGYHARWNRDKVPDEATCWKVTMPITTQGRLFGRIEVIGSIENSNSAVILDSLAILIESLQSELGRVASDRLQPVEPAIKPETELIEVAV
jgi:UDP-GlcNAc:undecaprenyl-phosphate/decaprenyl-phosphate GlcNAc-1-phosphate transferase